MKILERAEYATKPKPLTCDPKTTIRDAALLMAERNYGSIIAVDAGMNLLGMMTERDIFQRVVATSLDPSVTTVGDVMTTNVRTAKEDDDLLDWLRIMSNERFRRLPIVNDDGKLIAVMSQGDFVSYTWPDLLENATTLARATFQNSLSAPMILGGVLLYTLILVVAVGLTT